MLKYNLEYIKYIRLAIISVLLSAVLIFAGKFLCNYILVLGIVIIIIGVIFLLLGLLFIKAAKSSVAVYNDGLLIPAIVIEEPNVMLTMADVGNEGNDVYAIKKVKLHRCGNEVLRKGDKVTFCAYFDNSDDDLNIWTMYVPSFVPWATDDKEVLRACVNAIDEEEWTLIKAIAPCVNDLEFDTVYIVDINDGKISFNKARRIRQEK